ncbi:MAG: hypothetical protein PVJ66_10300, partial [Gammaproteobacteria bacterium]
MSSHSRSRCGVPGTLLLLCSLLPGLVQAVEREYSMEAVRLSSLARALVDAPAPMRADFAWIVIAEMASMYAEEAARARREPGKGGDRRGLLRWSGAVEAFADDLAALSNAIGSGTPVDISTGPDNTVYLYIEGRPVIVNSPRGGRQAEFERRVQESFCRLHPCESLVIETPTPVPLPGARPSMTHWSFSQQAGPACVTDDGLEFQFRDMTNLRRNREICGQVIAELNALAGQIARQQSRGVRVDWNTLTIQPLPGTAQHRVLLNGSGNDIQMALPLLAARQDLFRIVRPWLAAKAGGDTYHLVVVNAGRLFAE